jgi:hypothetical protein
VSEVFAAGAKSKETLKLSLIKVNSILTQYLKNKNKHAKSMMNKLSTPLTKIEDLPLYWHDPILLASPEPGPAVLIANKFSFSM